VAVTVKEVAKTQRKRARRPMVISLGIKIMIGITVGGNRIIKVL
jgi:predicted nucleic acid-binding Zn ribbon protein